MFTTSGFLNSSSPSETGVESGRDAAEPPSFDDEASLAPSEGIDCKIVLLGQMLELKLQQCCHLDVMQTSRDHHPMMIHL
jgi:hypothetical protein